MRPHRLAFLEEGGARVVAHYAKTLYEPVVLKKGYAEDMRGSSLEGLMEGDRLRLIHDLEAYLEQRASSYPRSCWCARGCVPA